MSGSSWNICNYAVLTDPYLYTGCFVTYYATLSVPWITVVANFRGPPGVPPQAQRTVRGHAGLRPFLQRVTVVGLLPRAGRCGFLSGIEGLTLFVPGQQQGCSWSVLPARPRHHLRTKRHLTATRLSRRMRYNVQADTRHGFWTPEPQAVFRRGIRVHR